MKKEKILLLIITMLLVSLTSWKKVKAGELPYWAEDITPFTAYYLADLSTSSYTLPSLSYNQLTKADNTPIPYYVNSSSVTIATNGIMSIFPVNQSMLSGYVYSITYYYCTNKLVSWNNSVANIFLGTDISTTANRQTNTFESTNLTTLNSLATEDGTGHFTSCAMSTSIVVPSAVKTYAGIRLKAKSDSVTGVYISSLGFEIKELGMYTENVRSILNSVISNSGLASASSVQQVQTSVNQVQQEITNVNGSIQTQTQQQQQNHNETMNADYTGETEQPNMTDYNSYETNEETLLNVANGMDLNSIAVGIDGTTSSKIWEIITRLFQSNTIVFTMLLSILSVGVIKLMLNR